MKGINPLVVLYLFLSLCNLKDTVSEDTRNTNNRQQQQQKNGASTPSTTNIKNNDPYNLSSLFQYTTRKNAWESVYRFCYDSRTNCKELVDTNKNNNICTESQWMKSHCPVSCNRCNEIIQIVPNTNSLNPVIRHHHNDNTIIMDAISGGITQSQLVGVPQILPKNNDIHNDNDTDLLLQDAYIILYNATKYLINEVHVNPKYSIILNRCKNKNPYCLLYSLDGYCDNDDNDSDNENTTSTNKTKQRKLPPPTFNMDEECGPICQSCHNLHMSIRCPMPHPNDIKNAWYPGDMDKMFERIATDPTINSQYNVTVLSQPNVRPVNVDITEVEHEDYKDIEWENVYTYDDEEEDEEENDIDDEHVYSRKERLYVKQLIRDEGGLWILIIDNFLSKYETDRLIAMGSNAGYERSMDAGDELENGENEDVLSEERTSTNAWCTTDECINDHVSTDVYNRMSELTGINVTTNSEPFQLLRYEVGQFYKSHHDLIEEDNERQQGVRIVTIFLYLNTIEEGGGTNFPYLNITVQPVQGRAVVWPSVYNNKPNIPDLRATHQALPVLGINEIKYGANVWIHQRRIEEDC